MRFNTMMKEIEQNNLKMNKGMPKIAIISRKKHNIHVKDA